MRMNIRKHPIWLIVTVAVLCGIAFYMSGAGRRLARILPGSTEPSYGLAYEAMQSRLEVMDRDIVFPGRVVNESGKPVPEADVTIELRSIVRLHTGQSLSFHSEASTVSTDENGYFVFKGNGHLVRIINISGPGKWLYDLEISGRYERVPGNTHYGYAPAQGSQHYQPNAKRPAVFVLVRPDIVIKAWPTRGGADGVSAEFMHTNTPVIPFKPSIPLTYTDNGWVYRPDP